MSRRRLDTLSAAMGTSTMTDCPATQFRSHCENWQAPRVLVQDAPLRNVAANNLNVRKPRFEKLSLQVYPAENPHFQGRAGTAVKNEIFMQHVPAISCTVHHNEVSPELNDAIVVQIREVLDGGRIVGERHRQDQMSAGLEQVEDASKGARHWRGYMLEYIG